MVFDHATKMVEALQKSKEAKSEMFLPVDYGRRQNHNLWSAQFCCPT